MTDLTTLATKLAALISEDDVFTSDGARVISQADNPPALVALLREIDDTVLARSLLFGLGDMTVSIAVADRRMRGIVAIDGDMPGKDKIIGKPLSVDTTDLTKAMGAMLKHLCQTAQMITVRSQPPQQLGTSADKGLSVAKLAEAWQVDMGARAAPPMERFITANADRMQDHLYLSGNDVIASEGDAALLQPVWDNQVAKFRKSQAAVQPKQDGPMLVCLDAALGGKKSVGLASFGKESCLFSYQPDDLPDLLATWSSVTA